MKTYSRPSDQPIRAIGYGRVSTDEQAESGAGLDAQRAAIEAETTRREWELVAYIEDRGYSAKSLDRPGIQSVLDHLRDHKADVLLVSKLDRLSRSMLDFADLLERRSKEEGWSIVALDLGVDTSTPTGEAMANMTATFSRLERRLISQRTKDALAVKRRQGTRLGRPERVSGVVVTRIQAERDRGISLAAIASGLNADAIPTSQGGAMWHPSTVRAVLLSAQRDAESSARSGVTSTTVVGQAPSHRPVASDWGTSR
jgi:DNA invertase Pin-like site-specific DNA recombinase